MDFIIELPESEGCHTILTVVDQMMKMAHFIPCAYLLTTEDTTHLLIAYVFHLHSLPDHIISDWGTTSYLGFGGRCFPCERCVSIHQLPIIHKGTAIRKSELGIGIIPVMLHKLPSK